MAKQKKWLSCSEAVIGLDMGGHQLLLANKEFHLLWYVAVALLWWK